MIDVNAVPKVVVEFMNQDHQEAANITNALSSLVGAADNGEFNPKGICETFKELYDHCVEHFARENAQMEHFGFPPIECHRGEHEQVLAEMKTELEEWCDQEDLTRLKTYVDHTLPQWFIGHIETMDTVTAQFIERAGGPV